MITLTDVSLKYPLAGLASHSLQLSVLSKVGGVLGRSKGNHSIDYVEALKNINLTIHDGERLGILGHNGAGKTTLLRLLAGVYPPSSGKIHATGRINALTDVTLGMDANANGLQNILFRLVFMGYSFAEAKRAMDEIIEFSELGEFIHLPMRTYSTGMFLRLAFAISTHFTPDILILDEIIGAGDESFRLKAKQRLDSLFEKSRIVVLSSHDLGSVQNYCTHAILMSHGSIVQSGTPEEVIASYRAQSSA